MLKCEVVKLPHPIVLTKKQELNKREYIPTETSKLYKIPRGLSTFATLNYLA